MKLRTILAFSAMFALTACMTNLQKLNKKDTSGHTFNQYLAEGYKEIANDQKKEYGWVNSEHLAKKGLDAANGKEVYPWHPNSFKIHDKSEVHELTEAREDLMEALQSHAMKRHSKSLAAAQVNYDAWLFENVEGWNKEEIRVSKDRFYSFLTDGVFKRGGKLDIRTMEDGYVVYFDFNRSSLNHIDHENLTKMIRYLMLDNPSYVTVDGYADSLGSEKSNKAISFKRAQVVAGFLKEHGLKHKIKISGHGDHPMAFDTSQGVKEERNRRVEIRAQR